MAKNKVSEYSSTASQNTDIGNININEGCAPSNINNAIRELMAQIKDFQQGADGDGLTVSTLNATTATVGSLSATSLSATSFGAITATSANISGALTTASAAITTATITNVQVADGTAAAPSITNTGDTNTGVFFPADNEVGLATDGSERVRIDSSGNVGIGTSSPGGILDISTTNPTVNIIAGSGGFGNVFGKVGSTILWEQNWGTDYVVSYVQNGSYYVGTKGASGGLLSFETKSIQRSAIDVNGNFTRSLPGVSSTQYPDFCARAWVNFNGTGTPAIRGSGNVSSITDNNTGDYTVNFTTAMPDANYSATASSNGFASTNTNQYISIQHSGASPDAGSTSKTTTSVRVITGDGGTLRDGVDNNVVIHR